MWKEVYNLLLVEKKKLFNGMYYAIPFCKKKKKLCTNAYKYLKYASKNILHEAQQYTYLFIVIIYFG